jgi:hypothetical protein
VSQVLPPAPAAPDHSEPVSKRVAGTLRLIRSPRDPRRSKKKTPGLTQRPGASSLLCQLDSGMGGRGDVRLACAGRGEPLKRLPARQTRGRLGGRYRQSRIGFPGRLSKPWSRFSRGRRERQGRSGWQWRRFDLLAHSVHQARHQLSPRQHDQEGRGSRRQHHEHDFLSHHGKTPPDSCSPRCVIIVASSRQRPLLSR